jgi:prophage regulatory protein
MQINNDLKSAKQILRLDDIKEITGLSRSTIYDRGDVNSPRFDPKFPKRIKIGLRAVGWLQGDLDAWLDSMIQLSSAGGEEGL